MRAEIGASEKNFVPQTKTITDLNERIVSANLLDRARRTGVPA
jgi:hypothetical protein